MNTNQDAISYLALATKAAERGDTKEALRYIDKAQTILLREAPIEIDLDLGRMVHA